MKLNFLLIFLTYFVACEYKSKSRLCTNIRRIHILVKQNFMTDKHQISVYQIYMNFIVSSINVCRDVQVRTNPIRKAERVIKFF